MQARPRPPLPPSWNMPPSNDLRPDDEDLIQPYLDKERQLTWIYLPLSVRKSAEVANIGMLNCQDLYLNARQLHIAVVEEINKKGTYIIFLIL